MLLQQAVPCRCVLHHFCVCSSSHVPFCILQGCRHNVEPCYSVPVWCMQQVCQALRSPTPHCLCCLPSLQGLRRPCLHHKCQSRPSGHRVCCRCDGCALEGVGGWGRSTRSAWTWPQGPWLSPVSDACGVAESTVVRHVWQLYGEGMYVHYARLLCVSPSGSCGRQSP